MSGSAHLDLRYPIGGLFVVLGVLLAAFGFVTRSNATIYAPSLGLNINLLWGGVMLVVGMLFLGLAAASARRERGPLP